MPFTCRLEACSEPRAPGPIVEWQVVRVDHRRRGLLDKSQSWKNDRGCADEMSNVSRRNLL